MDLKTLYTYRTFGSKKVKIVSHMKQVIIITFLAFHTFSIVHSQVKVTAVVLDEKGGPVPYASVYNDHSLRGVITNEEGRFELDAQPNDSIRIRCLGYQEHNRVRILFTRQKLTI